MSNESLLPFERPRKTYKLTANKEDRKQTFTLLRAMKEYCTKEAKITPYRSRREKFQKISDAVDRATRYLEDNKTRSNVRIDRFYRFLSLPQKKALLKNRILTLNDLTKKTRNDLCHILRYRTHSGEYASPTFLTILGS